LLVPAQIGAGQWLVIWGWVFWCVGHGVMIGLEKPPFYLFVGALTGPEMTQGVKRPDVLRPNV